MLAQEEHTVRIFNAGGVVLQSGRTLPDVTLVYETHGTLNNTRDNVILYPTRYGGNHTDNRYLIGSDHALDPSKYFIVVPNMLGNGESTSPSNAAASVRGSAFPLVTIYDNVVLQRRLLDELGVTALQLVVGWSMGGQQAYQWACLYPGMVRRMAVICGASRTAPHTYVFLEGVKAALTCDPSWAEFGSTPERGLRALGRVWAGWALSQQFYRELGYHDLGYSSLEDFLVRYWESIYLGRDARNLVAMMRTWQEFDLSTNPELNGNYERAMRGITMPAVIMPGRTDLYFPPEDSALEVELLGLGRLSVIPSMWGHYAGGGRSSADVDFIDAELRSLLEEPGSAF
jgi:homoserine O-acetyltransferase/O-succinyltransferase